MKYSEYGRTGKLVSAVGFGGMRFDMEKSLAENAGLVKYAFDKGINYFDTAPDYCDGRSERIFGLAFKNMPREKFFVSDKLMPTLVNDAQEAYDKVRSVLDLMNIEYIDFFHVWCLRKMEHFEMAVRRGALYDGLLRCKEEGLIKHIAFSSHQKGNEVEKVIESGKFEGVLLGINILNFPYRRPGVLAARRHGLGVVAMNPLAGGLIPQNENNLLFLCSPGETPTEAALRFLIADENITVVLNGFTTREHVDTACRVAENAAPMTAADLERILRSLSENSLEICTSCGYCEVCPKGIPISKYMQIYNDKVLFNVSEADFAERLGFHYNWGLLAEDQPGAENCIACGKCEDRCTQHLPIAERMKEFARLKKEK
ncbi:MAG: aldo/keto reductase [Victivallaceae bacterium]|nr:aldo/keto reductase [Victivallaceae bacterium]